jgi:crotonobetainyl-CoA:carnitine CoA-transferase CaiB-like acyl-CoA transferase
MPPPPLAGVRVLDLTNVLAGPYCTYQLALLGAEVVKVEVPGSGDLARQLGADPALNERRLGASFLAQNAGKQSVELDLKAAPDREVFLKLIRAADVLVENFRAGVLARLGFGWPELSSANPRLVYCAISGFGQTGPMSQAPAYDQIIQGLSGMMSITGTPETAPLRVGFPVCDAVGGLSAALAVVSALAGRDRHGQGCHLDVSMLEASMSAMGWAVSNYLICGVTPEPMGAQNFTAVPSGTFDAADGPLNIAANRQEQFERLCRCVEREDLLADPRFASGEIRKLHRGELNRELNSALVRRPAAEWERLLNAVGVPAARILEVPDAVELEQLAHRNFFADVAFPGSDGGQQVRVSGSGVLFDGQPHQPRSPAPLLGEHNDQVDEILRRWQAAEPAPRQLPSTPGTDPVNPIPHTSLPVAAAPVTVMNEVGR